jgi:hypothetical protein
LVEGVEFVDAPFGGGVEIGLNAALPIKPPSRVDGGDHAPDPDRHAPPDRSRRHPGALDEQTGEAVHAFVVPATDEAPDLDGLVAPC